MSEGPDYRMDDSKSEPRYGFSYNLADFMLSMVKVTGILVIVLMLFLRYAVVEGESMLPTFQDRDRVFAANVFYEPQRLDVVAVFDSKYYHKPLIKRVIGLEGDKISVDAAAGKVLVNDVALEEAYTLEPTTELGSVVYPVFVPEGYIFVMGDNRNNSRDSRFTEIGMIKLEAVIGKVVYRFFPFDKMTSRFS